MKKIIVTGASRGIGKEVVRRLLAEAPEFGTIWMTSTNVADVERTAAELRQETSTTVNLVPHQLNLLDAGSIAAFVDKVRAELAPVDVVLNNAGTAFKGDRLDDEVYTTTFGVNLFGTMQVVDALVDCMVPNGHMIIVSSSAGRIGSVQSPELQQRILNPDLTRDQLQALAEDFRATVNQGNFEEKGWKRAGYATSKVLLNAYIRILDRELRAKGSQLRVNALHPGWVRTDMAGPNAPEPVEAGAVCPVFLAKDTSERTGKFFDNHCQEWDW